MFPKTFSLFIARNFIFWLLSSTAVFGVIIFMFDFLELLRRSLGKAEVTTWIVAELALLQLPSLLSYVFPFMFLLGTMLCLWRLNRYSELVVARALGFSIWQFVAPMVMVTLLFACFEWVVWNPAGAMMMGQSERLEAQTLRRQAGLLTLSQSGLWLFQNEKTHQHDGYVLLNARRIGKDGVQGISLYYFDNEDRYIKRVEAENAHLRPHVWELHNAVIFPSGQSSQRCVSYDWPTTLQMSKIEQQFMSPQALSLWQLPDFISLLEKSGISSRTYQAHMQTLWARPFLYLAMIIFGTLFSLQLTRMRRHLRFVLSGLGTGFGFYLANNVTLTLGITGDIPITLAVWCPISVALLAGIAALLHLEDG